MRAGYPRVIALHVANRTPRVFIRARNTLSWYSKRTDPDIIWLQADVRRHVMNSLSLSSVRRITAAFALCAAISGLASVPAQARVFIGVGIGVPFYAPGFYPAPFYYPPPVYYAPPPVFYAPPQIYVPGPAVARTGPGQACYAGPYVCPMDRPVAPGAGCFCLGNGGQRVPGRAN